MTQLSDRLLCGATSRLMDVHIPFRSTWGRAFWSVRSSVSIICHVTGAVIVSGNLILPLWDYSVKAR